MSALPYSGAALKRSAAHFLLGKGASAMITFVILLWMVRLLPVEQYGVYVTLVAGLELAIAVSGFGMIWLAARYLPEYRMHATGPVLSRFVWQFLAQISGLLVAGTLVLYFLLPAFMAALGLAAWQDIGYLYLPMLLLEGAARHVRESLLGPLMQQGWAQLSLVVRNIALLLLLGILSVWNAVSLREIVIAEVAASALGLVIGLYGLARHLRHQRRQTGAPEWRPPRWLDMWPTAGNMYSSQMVSLIYSAQVFVFLVQRYLGVEATALFGFLRSLYDQVTRYLPAALLFGIIRPKLVASYVGDGGMAALVRNANLVGKLSLFALMPMVVLTWWAGPGLVGVLSGGAFAQPGYYLAGLMLALIPFSQRQIVETLAVAVGRSRLCTVAAACSAISLPLTLALLWLGLGLWAPVIGIGTGNLIFNVVILGRLAWEDAYRADRNGMLKLLAAASLSLMLLAALPVTVDTWPSVFVAAIACCLVYLVTAYLIKPFTSSERESINRLANRKIFVW